MSISNDAGCALRHLIQNDVIAPEELLGIERMIVPNNAPGVAAERKAHASFIENVHMGLAEVHSDLAVNADVVANLAMAKSAKHVKEARLRASLAA